MPEHMRLSDVYNENVRGVRWRVPGGASDCRKCNMKVSAMQSAKVHEVDRSV